MGAWQVRGTSSSICTWTGAREPAVADAYSSWPGAPAGEEGRRFAAYTAALDREEAAAFYRALGFTEDDSVPGATHHRRLALIPEGTGYGA